MGGDNPLRQKMINMMYLVLTALLALNVSAEILKAFALVNGSLNRTNTLSEQKTEANMVSFEKTYKEDPQRAELLWRNAQQVRAESKKMYNYIDSLKEYVATDPRAGGGWEDANDDGVITDDEKVSTHHNKDLEAASRIMVTDKNGDALRARLTAYEKKMESLLINAKGEPTPGAVPINLNTGEPPQSRDGSQKAWSVYYFERIPLIAALTQLTKWQNDVRTIESEMINYLSAQVGANIIKIDDFVPIVKPKQPAVYQGQTYEAEIYLGAVTTTAQPEIFVNGKPLPVEGGKAVYTDVGRTLGDNKVDVVIKAKNAKGEMEEYTYNTVYSVFGGNATISATKMNVLYIGLENPISVSVPGFEPRNVTASASGPSPLKNVKPGEYMIRPVDGQREVTISVTAKMPDGTNKNMGSAIYRVRRVPNPEVYFGRPRNEATVSRGELQTVNSLTAGLGETFAFEGLNFTVVGYTIVIAERGGGAPHIEQVQGNMITAQTKAAFGRVKPNAIIAISEVSVRGPDGRVKPMSGPSLTVR